MPLGLRGFQKGNKLASYKGKKRPDLSLARKGKKYEDIFGIEKARRIKNNQSVKRMGSTTAKKGKIYPHLHIKYPNRSGPKHFNFQGWRSREPYGKDFSPELREQIRKRDRYRCQQCFRHQDELRTKSNKLYRLNIHHIDYDKKNNDPVNLISLCKVCHTQTNYSREDWERYFKNKQKCSI